jgi:choline dehydrogenase-like flavoprotein
LRARVRRGTSERTFDVLVVGGGSAGCAVAACISKDPDCSVCVVDVGLIGWTLGALIGLYFAASGIARASRRTQ